MSEQTRQFGNDTISVQCTERPGCIIEMTVTVSPTGCQAVQQKALKEVRKEASLPGFRQGHIPEQIVLKHFKPQLIRKTQSMIMSTAFDDAVRLVDRQPFSKNSLRKANLEKFSKEQGAELHFLFEASPKIPTVDVENLQLTRVDPKPVDEKDFEERYLWWRFQGKKISPVDSRPCLEGDIVNIQMMDSEASKADKKPIYLHKNLPSWLYTALIGSSVGETKKVTIPAEGESSERTIQLTIESIQSCELPEETDEFAKSLGEESIAAVRKKIREQLELEARIAAQDRMRRQVRNELIRLYAFDLPQSLIEQETDSRFQSHWKTLSEEEKKASDKEAVRKTFLNEVMRHFTCLMLLESLFKTVKPSYTNRQLSDEYFRQIQLPPEKRTYFASLSEEEIVQRLLMEIAMRQCEDYCIEKRLGLHPPQIAEQETHSDTCHCGSDHCESESSDCCCGGGGCRCTEESDL